MNIFITNLDKSVTAQDLQRTFEDYGTVVNAVVLKDDNSGHPIGRAHVYVVPDKSAREAIEELNFAPLRGRPIKVRECVYRTRKDRRLHTNVNVLVDRRQRNERRTQPAA